MKEKYDLKKMLEEIEKDEAIEKDKTRLMTQDEIQQLIDEKSDGRERKNKP
jgi:hypothetical protein